MSGAEQAQLAKATALGVVQFGPGCVDVKAKLTVLTGVVYKQ